jgi:hypothetical protein
MLKNIAMAIGAVSGCIISSAGTVWYIITDINKQNQKTIISEYQKSIKEIEKICNQKENASENINNQKENMLQ